METILQLNRQELHEEIMICIRELLKEMKNTSAPSLPDRITLLDACLITGLSKASIYSMTHNEKIPFMKFGRRLVFSRKELTQWMDSMTVKKESLSDLMIEALQKSANKKLKRSL